MRYVIREIDDMSKSRNTNFDMFKHVTFYFSFEGKNEVYENKFTNIVLFLSELDDFIDELDDRNISCWYWSFAPFAFGKFEGNELKISSHSGIEFNKYVYESMDRNDLDLFKDKIRRDIKRFGRLHKKV